MKLWKTYHFKEKTKQNKKLKIMTLKNNAGFKKKKKSKCHLRLKWLFQEKKKKVLVRSGHIAECWSMITICMLFSFEQA